MVTLGMTTCVFLTHDRYIDGRVCVCAPPSLCVWVVVSVLYTEAPNCLCIA